MARPDFFSPLSNFASKDRFNLLSYSHNNTTAEKSANSVGKQTLICSERSHPVIKNARPEPKIFLDYVTTNEHYNPGMADELTNDLIFPTIDIFLDKKVKIASPLIKFADAASGVLELHRTAVDEYKRKGDPGIETLGVAVKSVAKISTSAAIAYAAPTTMAVSTLLFGAPVGIAAGVVGIGAGLYYLPQGAGYLAEKALHGLDYGTTKLAQGARWIYDRI